MQGQAKLNMVNMERGRWSEWCGVRWRQVDLEVEFEGMSSVEQMGSESTEVGWRSLERAE